MREEFLQLYADNICRHSRPFDGILELLGRAGARGLKWGVVTNKPALHRALMSMLDLAERAACIVSGDTCPQPKPHPAPMLAAAELCGATPAQCLYLGDAERDIEAARAAAMPALVAAWGYLDASDQPLTWGATRNPPPGRNPRLPGLSMAYSLSSTCTRHHRLTWRCSSCAG
jgi:phosphoglycolate phosphatase